MFLTQEKVLKKIFQDRSRGDLKRARKRALEALDRWPDDYNLAMEAIRLCIDLNDFHQAVSLLKPAIQKHPKNRSRILDYARETYRTSFNPFLGSFILELLLRGRDFEAIIDMLHTSHKSFIDDLIKRSETRSKGPEDSGQTSGQHYTDNKLLLGLLYMENEEFEKAVEPLGHALEQSPESAQAIGSRLLELERALPENSLVKYYIGLASTMLSHEEKGEPRFFQCLHLENPPLEKLLETVEGAKKRTANHDLLHGEILIRLERIDEGTALVRQYTSNEEPGWESEIKGNDIKQLFPEQFDRKEFTFKRLSALAEQYPGRCEIVFCYCDIAVNQERIKESVQALEILSRENVESISGIIAWIENHESLNLTAPAQKLLAGLHLVSGKPEEVSRAALMAADMDPVQVPALIQLIENHLVSLSYDDPELQVVLAELHARGGDSQSAGEIIRKLDGENAIEGGELLRLAGEVLKHSGVTVQGIVSAVELGIRNGEVTGSLPYIVQFCQEHDDLHAELAEELQRMAGKIENSWPLMGELVDSMAEELQLTRPFRMLQANTHLQNGAVERAVFEYDQLLMLDDSLRPELMRIYKEVAGRYRENTTLHLALYQLYLEEEMLAEAAHHLGITLQLDRSQIRDVLERFDRLVEKEPKNRKIWEELIGSAIEMDHLDLAKELLGRAIAALTPEDAAALHIYGSRISIAEGNTEDGLRCIALTLTSRHADLRNITGEIENIVTRDPANPEARYLMGETLLRLGREQDAVDSLRQCLKLSPIYRNKVREKLEELRPVSIQPWLISGILGEIAWAEGRRDDARKFLSMAQGGPFEYLPELGKLLVRFLEETPDDIRLSLIHARNLSLEGHYRQSVALLEKMHGSHEETVRPITDILLELLDAEPDQADANMLLSRIMLRSGESVKSLEPVLRLLEAPDLDPDMLDRFLSEFIPVHGDSSEFLIPYARLKVRKNEHGEALELYRQALDRDGGSWERISSSIAGHAWPDEMSDASRMLAADCLLGGQRNDEAFDIIKGFTDPGPGILDDVISRIAILAERNPDKEQYTFACRVLAHAGMLDRAEEFIRSGCDTLGEPDTLDLKTALAEALQGAGEAGRAAGLYREILESVDERQPVFKRIEETYEEWTRHELTSGLERAASGGLDEERIERLVNLALDLDDPESALAFVSGRDLPSRVRCALLTRIYLDMDRPLLALAIAGSTTINDSSPSRYDIEILYGKGLASERIGDHCRAAASFSRILELHGNHGDSRGRAEKNYTMILQSQNTIEARILEKTGNLEHSKPKGEETT